MSKKKRDPVLARAIEEAGGPTAVAEYIKKRFGPITVQAVSKWRSCPPSRVHQVEAAVKARRGKTKARELRPEMFA